MFPSVGRFPSKLIPSSRFPSHLHRNIHFSPSLRMGGPIQQKIETKLQKEFNPIQLEVINESHMHNVPKGSETHFKVVVISDAFKDMKLIDRHRTINSLLDEELKGGVHALSIQAKTLEQWEKSGHQISPSPACLGGMAREKKEKS